MAERMKTYEEGVTEGRMYALEQMMADHKGRLDNHSQRLRVLERVIWGFFGIVVLVQIYPALARLLEAAGP